MTKPHIPHAAALALALSSLIAAPAAAQVLSTTDATIRNGLCIGPDCADDPGMLGNELYLRSQRNQIFFEDTTASGGGVTDWEFEFNSATDDNFVISDLTNGTAMFQITAAAPDNAFFMAADGDIGLGTMLPQAPLHVQTESTNGIRLERSNTLQEGGALNYELFIRDGGDFGLFSSNAGASPFVISPFASKDSLILDGGRAVFNADALFRDFYVLGIGNNINVDPAFKVESTGNIGMGTNNPEQKLHIRTTANNTDAFALFDAAGSGSDAAFLLRQQGTVPTTWEFRNQQSSGKLNVGVVGGTKPLKIDRLAATNLLRLGLNGEPDVVSITGELRVNNTALNVPDYVFADDYTLRPLADVRAFIDANSHLPEVPSEADIKANGLNMTQMQMTLLKKVEELTLYTLKQEAIIADLTARMVRIERQPDTR